MTYHFVVNVLPNWATLFGNNFGKEKNYKIILDFIVYFEIRHNIKVSHTTLLKNFEFYIQFQIKSENFREESKSFDNYTVPNSFDD